MVSVRIEIPNSGVVFEGTYASVVDDYRLFGGSEEFLGKNVRRAIAAWEHGSAVATAVEHLNAHVVEDSGEEDWLAKSAEGVVDPWDSHPSERKTQPAPSHQAGQQHRGDPAQYLGEDRFGGKYYADPSAPNCKCGTQCIRKAAISQRGKRYGAHVCWNAGPRESGADYRLKCDYSEFTDRKN
jgi:hypothetical protein